jgi:hypothetical protein
MLVGVFGIFQSGRVLYLEQTYSKHTSNIISLTRPKSSHNVMYLRPQHDSGSIEYVGSILSDQVVFGANTPRATAPT